MKPTLWRNVAWLFLAALVLYAMGFAALSHWRARRGPWQVTFTAVNSQPVVRIDQPRLGITNFTIRLAGQTVTNDFSQTLRFAEPRPWPFAVPFGRVVFMDTTVLPGNVTFELFDHQIQLLPQTLTVDGAEYSWRGTNELTLAARGAKAGGFP